MKQIKKILFQRLEKKGINRNFVPGFIRCLANSFCDDPDMSLSQINRHLNYIGWDGVELDYHTLQLAIACLEDEGLPYFKNKPAGWFEVNFSPHGAGTAKPSIMTAKAAL